MTRVHLAANNNAHLYKRVCEAHGCPTAIDDSMLLCLDKPPRYYAQAVSLCAGVGEIITRRVTGAFKDSFSDIQPDPTKYKTLFSAEWIWLDKAYTDIRSSIEWKTITTCAELEEWESSWARGDNEATDFPRQFPLCLLNCPDMKFYSAWKNNELIGGVLVNVTPPIIGISNVYVLRVSEQTLWTGIVSLARVEFPGLHMTGYARDHALHASLKAGFESIGKLRIWIPTA